mgnify:CR=1 FL=1
MLGWVHVNPQGLPRCPACSVLLCYIIVCRSQTLYSGLKQWFCLQCDSVFNNVGIQPQASATVI